MNMCFVDNNVILTLVIDLIITELHTVVEAIKYSDIYINL